MSTRNRSQLVGRRSDSPPAKPREARVLAHMLGDAAARVLAVQMRDGRGTVVDSLQSGRFAGWPLLDLRDEVWLGEFARGVAHDFDLGEGDTVMLYVEQGGAQRAVRRWGVTEGRGVSPLRPQRTARENPTRTGPHALLSRGLPASPRPNPSHWPLSEALQNFVDGLDASQKIVMLTEPLDLDRLARELRALDGKQETHAKPLGFWYACGGAWIEYAASDVPTKFGPWIYELDLDPSRVLALRSRESVRHLGASVGAKGGAVIRWGALARAFDGVEACPWYSDLRDDDRVAWYHGWDVPSGCFWSMDVLRGVRLLRGPPIAPARSARRLASEVRP